VRRKEESQNKEKKTKTLGKKEQKDYLAKTNARGKPWPTKNNKKKEKMAGHNVGQAAVPNQSPQRKERNKTKEERSTGTEKRRKIGAKKHA